MRKVLKIIVNFEKIIQKYYFQTKNIFVMVKGKRFILDYKLQSQVFGFFSKAS